MSTGEGEVRFSSLSSVMQGILILLTILGIVVPCTLGFVNFDKRLDISEAEAVNYQERTEKRLDKISGDVEVNEDDIQSMQLQNARIEENQKEILRRIDASEENQKQRHIEFMNFIRNFEVTE